MSAAILRGEAERGRLAIEKTGKQYYTTLRAIEDMREKCRTVPKAQGSGCARPGEAKTEPSPIQQHGSSETPADIAAARAAAKTTFRELKESLRRTSHPNTLNKPRVENVVPIKSRSRTSSRSTAATSR
jgi:hypothetical protein